MGKLSRNGRMKKIEAEFGYAAKRHRVPPPPKGDFTPRAVRRRSVVSSVPQWRPIWTATRGWGELVKQFAERAQQMREARAG